MQGLAAKPKGEEQDIKHERNAMELLTATKTEAKTIDRKISLSGVTYTAEKVIGQGSFGSVYQARIAETGEVVAIKKVFQDKRYKNRELQIMQELNHPNMVTLKKAFYTCGENVDEVYLNIVMDYVADNAYKVVKNYTKVKQRLPLSLVKLYAYQLCRALGYLQALNICHRDIKPQNVLIDSNTHVLKLCDFGSAKKLVHDEPNVAYICSRYYRAPELIFGATDYTPKVDVWSAGCVVAEFLLGQPLFPGESGVDQLVEVIKVLGTPTRSQITAMNPNYKEYKFPQIRAHPLHKIFPSEVPRVAIDFLAKLLVYDPVQRLSPMEALLHPFVDELRLQSTRLPNDNPLPDLFNFTPEERRLVKADELPRFIPSWYLDKASSPKPPS